MATFNENRDAAATNQTGYTMAVGDTFNGDLGEKFDEDWIEIRLERGETYKINLSGRGSKGDEAEDTILKLYDAGGNLVAENDDINTAGRIYDSELEFTPTTTGTYYLSAGSYSANPNRDNSGAYTLTVVLSDGTTPTDPTDPTPPPDPTPDPTPGPDITGTNASETLRGTEQGETIEGRGGSDTLIGLGGNDILDGGSGGDTLEGGPGADVLIGGTGTNTASYSRSDVGVTVRLHTPTASRGDAQGDSFGRMVTYTYTDNGRSVSVQVPDIINLTGSDEDDVLAGDARANTLRGGDGDDTLYGGPGGDNTNDDRMYGEEGDDRLFGGRGNDRLFGGDDNDLLRGGPHNDLLEGGAGDDDLGGGDGNDTLEGGDGEDTLSGEAGNDELQGNADDDTLSGGDGRDDLFGGTGNDIVDGGNDNDDLFGGDGDDTLIGGNGNDDLEGGEGDDILEGGAGDDDLVGGFGADTFKFSSGEGDDVIEDFTPGEDKIDLSTISSIDDFEDLDTSESGNNVRIELPGRGELTLENVSSVDEDDFIFRGSGTGTTDPGTTDPGTTDPGTPVVGDPQANRLHGGSRNDGLDGGDGDDVLYGARGNDTLTGGAGVDSYEGGPGDDTIVVDYDDFTDGKAAPNTGDRMIVPGVFDGGPGSDTLSFADFKDEDGDGNGVTVSATGGVTYDSDAVLTGLYRSIENFIGSPSDDTITGDAGDNVIEGGDGQDILTGGDGSDTVSYRSSPSSVTIILSSGGGSGLKGHAAGDTLSGFANIIGSAHDDILTGDASANVIEGLAGADTLDGGDGNDTLSYASSNAGVTIDLARGIGDFDDSDNTIKTASGGHAAGDKIKFGSFENITGSAHGDTLTGDNNANTLKGGAGSDTLKGDDGDDILDGGPSGDTLDGGDGEDTATYADATEGVTIDLSSVSESNNVVTIRNSGGRGDARGDRFIDIEKFIGSDHDDTFIAGPEVDNVDGGGGSNTISYQSSRDPVEVVLPDSGSSSTQDINQDESRENNNYAKGDILTNIDNIIGSNVSSGTATIHGDSDQFHDVLTGNSNDNEIDGRGGDDSINGGGGNDTLIGGSGSDTLTGGGGTDTFVISGRDTITDFAASDDKLSFGSSPRTLNLNYTIDDNSNLVITSGSHHVTLTGITAVTGLTATNFDFSLDGYVKLTDNNPTGTGTRGNTTIHGGEGDNRLTGGSNIDIINGNGGDDNITGGNGDDTLNGGAGDDTIEGGAGADTMDGGAGDNDTLSYAGSSRGTTSVTDGTTPNPRSGVTVTLTSIGAGPGENLGTHAEEDSITGGFENLIGSRYDDKLEGGSGENVIKGGSGNDWLISGGSDNRLEGGSGRDRLDGGSVGGFLSYEGSGSGVSVDLSDRSTSTTLSDADAALFDTATLAGVIKVSGGDASGDLATGFVNVIGGRGGDTLTGDDAANELRGMGGNDTLTGNDGDDILKGGEGRDTLRGGVGDDMLDGGAGADTLDGGGTQAVSGTDIATYASAEAGVTVDLSGGNRGAGDAAGDSFDGIERYEGSYHVDSFIAGDDPDHIIGGPTTGGPGGSGDTSSDTVSYARSDEGVTVDLSSSGTQSSNGYASGDTLTNIENVIGSSHGDNLTAAGGGSVLTGGRGDDTLTGGGGSDTFVFASGDGDDEINSFTIADDKIDLSAFTSIASLDDLRDSNDSNGEISVTGSAVEINLPNNGEIRLNGVTTDTLTADNFIFYTKPISGNTGDRFNNEINGGRGDDAIYGEQGRDILNGGDGDDEIYGGEDKDTLNGGEGDDWLDGGPGADTFVFEPGSGNDYIMDFTSGDRIELRGFTDAEGTALIALLDDNTGATDGNFVIDLPDGGTITVLGDDSLAVDTDIFFMS